MGVIISGNQNQTGKQVGQNIPASVGEFGDPLVSELQPRYYEQAYRGQSFILSVAAAAGTAYTGTSGGTPLLAIWNPPGSGKNLVLLRATTNVVVGGSAAGFTQFRLYGGPTVTITQATVTTPISTLSLSASGSVAKGYSNVATTSSTALSFLESIGAHAWYSGVGVVLSPPITWDFAGGYIVVPGNMLALGAVTIPTSMTNDATLVWAEVAI
jgi:hypothetical protein